MVGLSGQSANPLDLSAYFGPSPDDDLGWHIAQSYHDKQQRLNSPELRRRVRAIAARAILWRASQVLGAARRSARPKRLPYPSAPEGELALAETLENIVGADVARAEDLVVEVREQKRADAVLMIDTSLSMTGRNLALAGVAAAVLSWRLPGRDCALVAFEGSATVLKPLGSTLGREQTVGKILDVPATGYTNIADALQKGLRELNRGKNRQRFGILITDGVYTEGDNPLRWAAQFPRLHVLMTIAYKMNRELCQRLAELGHGRCFPVDGYDELPYALNSLLREVIR